MSNNGFEEGQFLFTFEAGMVMVHFPPKKTENRQRRRKGVNLERVKHPVLIPLCPNIAPIETHALYRPECFFPPQREDLDRSIALAHRQRYPAQWNTDLAKKLEQSRDIDRLMMLSLFAVNHHRMTPDNKEIAAFAIGSLRLTASMNLYHEGLDDPKLRRTIKEILTSNFRGKTKHKNLWEGTIKTFAVRAETIGIETQKKMKEEAAAQQAQEAERARHQEVEAAAAAKANEAATAKVKSPADEEPAPAENIRKKPVKQQPAEKEKPQIDEALVQRQIDIVRNAIAKANEGRIAVTDYHFAMERLGKLHEDGKIAFRDTIILLRHAFMDGSNPQETLDILQENQAEDQTSVADISALQSAMKRARRNVTKLPAANENKVLIDRVSDWRVPKLG